jgi:hypothetical protein
MPSPDPVDDLANARLRLAGALPLAEAVPPRPVPRQPIERGVIDIPNGERHIEVLARFPSRRRDQQLDIRQLLPRPPEQFPVELREQTPNRGLTLL